jgi:hypothetical protein
MKINPIMAAIAFAIAALAGYGFFAWAGGEPLRILLGIGGGICLFVPMGGVVAVTTTGGQGGTGNIRVLSVLVLVVEVIIKVIFGFMTPQTAAPYVVINGIIVVAYVGISYAMMKALENA